MARRTGLALLYADRGASRWVRTLIALAGRSPAGTYPWQWRQAALVIAGPSQPKRVRLR
jgi:hypothetical protein